MVRVVEVVQVSAFDPPETFGFFSQLQQRSESGLRRFRNGRLQVGLMEIHIRPNMHNRLKRTFPDLLSDGCFEPKS